MEDTIHPLNLQATSATQAPVSALQPEVTIQASVADSQPEVTIQAPLADFRRGRVTASRLPPTNR